jgi:hypothetical protein
MKNFIFISPNFPANYWNFCKELKANGFQVLGIGDSAYYELPFELRENLTEYYKVGNLEHYDEVYRAVAFFIHKYGKVDWLESNNEYWLERDAALRTDFNITSGFLTKDMPRVKFKSKMKPYYKKAGIKTAAYCFVTTFANCKKFTDKYGFPVIVKPDNGVGANATYKLHDEQQVKSFLKSKPSSVKYIMEEYIEAEVNSYDAIINSKGEPIFETGNVTPFSLMDVVNNNDNSVYYIVNHPFEDVRSAGRRAVKAFKVKSRFIHFEFFRLTKDQRIGKKGEVVALEVNMRPAGGVSPDMMNFANSTNVYKIWADMIAYDSTLCPTGEKFYCGFAGRRDGKNFAHSEEEIFAKYSSNIKKAERIPQALSGAMANKMFLANFKTVEELNDFYSFVLSEKAQDNSIS